MICIKLCRYCHAGMSKELHKEILYILSVASMVRSPAFAKLIRKVTSYTSQEDNKSNKIIVNHTAILMNYEDKWFICEVGSGGEIKHEFIPQETKKYYISAIGHITESEKEYVMAKYKDKITHNPIKAILKYPVLKAFASLELPQSRIIFRVINKIMDYIRDIYEATIIFLGVQIQVYCTESALRTVEEINFLRRERSNNTEFLNLGYGLLTLIRKQKYRLDEIYPQDIIENLDYIELCS